MWIKLRLAPMCPYIGSLSLAFVGPPIIKVQLLPYNRVRLMRIPILQASSVPMRKRDAKIKDVISLSNVMACCATVKGHWPPLQSLPVRYSQVLGARCSQSEELQVLHCSHHILDCCAQAFLTKLLTVDLPGLIVLPKRLDINIPPAVTAVAEAAVGRDAVMRAVASAVLQV